MSASDPDNKERNRQIAENEAERRVISAVRVSGWAIALAIVLGAIAVGIVLAWLNR